MPDYGNISTIFGYYDLTYQTYLITRDGKLVLGKSKDRILGRFDRCDLVEGFCSNQIDIENPDNVTAGWYLIIPEDNEDKCKAPKEGIVGYWISVN